MNIDNRLPKNHISLYHNYQVRGRVFCFGVTKYNWLRAVDVVVSGAYIFSLKCV